MANALMIVARRFGAIALLDGKGWKNRIQVRSETSDSLYIVAQRMTDNVWKCSCRGHVSHGRCKHVDTMKDALVAAFPNSRFEAQRVR